MNIMLRIIRVLTQCRPVHESYIKHHFNANRGKKIYHAYAWYALLVLFCFFGKQF